MKTGFNPVDYDAELHRHDRVFRRACGILARDRVLDVGCGAGRTTRDAARAAVEGNALGIDVAAPAIACARERAREEGVPNVAFVQANAQTHPFAGQAFDVAISRFGTMFFDDPRAAFRNLRSALAADGRLVMMVWQAREANAWTMALHGENPRSTAAFSLADPAAVEPLLEDAGFGHVAFQDVHEPVYYGDSVEAALDWIGQFQDTRATMRSMDDAGAAREQARLRRVVEQHRRDDGVWFDSRAWIVTARCR